MRLADPNHEDADRKRTCRWAFGAQQVLKILAVGLLFFLFGKMAVVMGRPEKPLVFPPAGLAAAIPLVFGYRYSVGVFLGAWCLGINMIHDPVTGTAVATGNTLEGLTAAWLINRFANGVHFYERPRDILRFILLAGAMSPLICPPFGLPGISVRSMAFWTNDYSTILVWWLGEMTSVLVLVPLVVTWSTKPRLARLDGDSGSWTAWKMGEFSLLMGLTMGVSTVVFSNLAPNWAQSYMLPCLCLPFPLWAAFRFGPKVTTLTIFAEAMVALWGTLHGYGLFARTVPDKALLAYQGFMSLEAAMGMLVAAVVCRIGDAQYELKLANEDLDLKIRQRTRELVEEIQLRKQAETIIAAANEHLENRVQERTADLTQLNKTLATENQRRRVAEEALSLVLRRLIDAQESERRRISRELHDEMGGQLTALKLGLRKLGMRFTAQAAGQPEPRKPSVRQLEEMADLLMQNLHRMAWELRPPTLDDLGIGPALQRYTEEWSGRSGITVQFQEITKQPKRLSACVETTLYRVTQEALTNVLKHSKARHVSVLLDHQPDCVSLIVEDDGQGFDPGEFLAGGNTSSNMGLKGMEERLGAVGGTLEIESEPHSGATLYARIPLNHKQLESCLTPGHCPICP